MHEVDAISQISNCLKDNKFHAIKVMDFSGFPIDDQAANILSDVIINNNTLEQLVLCNCKLQQSGIVKLTEALEKLTIHCTKLA